jgi:hypothetical protein
LSFGLALLFKSKYYKTRENTGKSFNEDYTSTYEELLHIAKVPSLQIRRMCTMTLECFKILYKLSPPCLNDLVVLKNSKHSFRYSNIVEIPRVKTTTYGKNSFKYTAAVLWNDLPNDFRKIANFKQLINILLSGNGNECKCNACNQF